MSWRVIIRPNYDPAGEKRRRAAAVQDAKLLPATCEPREASWTAPVLWRFDWGGRETLKEKLKPYLQTGEWSE